MISIIIPIYKVQKYLSQCIESVLKQSYKDLEIILVNDASIDKSLSICEKYASEDHRIILINKKNNGGPETARETGMAISSGEYVFYLDSDDWLDNSNILEKLYKTAKESEADYVEIGMQRVLDSKRWITSNFYNSAPLTITQPQLFQDYFLSFFGVNILSVNIWGKLYRRSILEQANIKPLGLSMGEDLAYNLQLFPYLKKIVLLNEPGYYYRIGGMTSQYNPHLLKDMKKLFYFKEEMITKYNYQKAVPFIRYELKNVLKTEICQKIAYKKASQKMIIEWISNEIKDPIYNSLYDIDPSENFWNDPFVIALIHRDSVELYHICKKIILKETPKRLLKKIALKLLNP